MGLLEDGVEVVPMVNQIEIHPLFVPQEIIEYCKNHGILVQAYAPLAGGPLSNASKATGGEANGTRILLEHANVLDTSLAVGKSPAQTVLRWGLQHGHSLIVKSSDAGRIAENAAIFDFSLNESQMDSINAIRQEGNAQKFCWDSRTVL